MSDLNPQQPFQPIDALKLFNEFQAQSRARFETTLKLIMGVSSAMLTLSVGAVLNSTSTKIPSALLPSLQLGWLLLFFSIAASVLLLCSMIVATFHMGVRWQQILEQKSETMSAMTIATWPWLRIANALLGLLILCSFLAGIALVAYVAIGVASNSTTLAAPASPHATMSNVINYQT
jgi:hypothetical protein